MCLALSPLEPKPTKEEWGSGFIDGGTAGAMGQKRSLSTEWRGRTERTRARENVGGLSVGLGGGLQDVLHLLVDALPVGRNVDVHDPVDGIDGSIELGILNHVH